MAVPEGGRTELIEALQAWPETGITHRVEPIAVRGGASIYNWMKQADIDDGVRPGLTQQEVDELREVKKRNRVLEEENLILRRAAAFFAKDISPK
ncbi:MAG: transposase-like protein [Acidimicrobiales bacterium]